jgi:hypothetical protein
MSVTVLTAPWPGEARAAVLGNDAPWRRGDLLRAAGLAAFGLAGLAGAWYAGSGQADWADVLPWASLGVAATSVAVLGLVSWLVAGLRRVRRLRREVLPLLQATAAQRSSANPATTQRSSAFNANGYVSAPGMTRFHLATCPLASGKPVRPLRRDAALADGLVACGVCAA